MGRGHVEGASAEVLQQDHARAGFVVGLAGRPVANTRQGAAVNKARLDVAAPPQVFTRHPRTRNAPDEPVAPMFVPHLPGRVPPAGWDGEMSAASPTRGQL